MPYERQRGDAVLRKTEVNRFSGSTLPGCLRVGMIVLPLTNSHGLLTLNRDDTNECQGMSHCTWTEVRFPTFTTRGSTAPQGHFPLFTKLGTAGRHLPGARLQSNDELPGLPDVHRSYSHGMTPESEGDNSPS